jgi:hypothetical protein
LIYILHTFVLFFKTFVI